MSLKILVVDDEANIRKTLTYCLETADHSVIALGTFDAAIDEAQRRVYDLAFVDIRLGERSGLDLVPELRRIAPWMVIVVITAYASISTAVEAIHLGAYDYIPKPFEPDEVLLLTAQVEERKRLSHSIHALETQLNEVQPELLLSSHSPAMQRIIATAKQAASSEAIILLTGESGIGKTRIARAIHSWSQRSEQPFGEISCPTLPGELLESELFGHVKGAFTGAVQDAPGRITACDGGTLFLDEIGDMALTVQPKLLRFLQDKKYERLGSAQTHDADVRILAATNTDLSAAVEKGLFREDLYYRLNVIHLEIPPLRDRPEDILPLAKHFLRFFCQANHTHQSGFEPQVIDFFKNYHWPGNVRELRNMIERAVILSQSESIGMDVLPYHLVPQHTQHRLGDLVPLEVIEAIHIRRVLSSTQTLQEAADILDIDQATLWRKRKRYKI